MGQQLEVKLCTAENCPIWPFRFGKNPFINRNQNLTDEQKAERANRMREYWNNKNKEKTKNE